jgi:hypothetical protein
MAGFVVENVLVLVEPCRQSLEVLRAALLVADRVELELVVRHAEAREQLVVELNDLGVDRRVVRSDRLDGELPELAVAAALWRGVAVEGPEGVELDGLRLAVEAVLEVRTRDRRRGLGPKREGAAALVLEGVHLLVHNIGSLPRRALEQRRVLEGRRLDRAVAVERAEALGLAGDQPPERLLGREDVVRASGRLEGRHEARSEMRKGLRSSSAPSVVGGP